MVRHAVAEDRAHAALLWFEARGTRHLGETHDLLSHRKIKGAALEYFSGGQNNSTTAH
jgi:hypothetical protein